MTFLSCDWHLTEPRHASHQNVVQRHWGADTNLRDRRVAQRIGFKLSRYVVQHLRREGRNRCTQMSPSASPCTSVKKKRCTIDDAILSRLAHLDEERWTFRQQDSEDFRFAAVIVDMLANVNPKHKPEVTLKIYQLLFEAGRDFPKQSWRKDSSSSRFAWV